MSADPHAARLIKHLAMPKRVRRAPPVNKALDVDECQKGWKKAKERTSLGPSGMHFGHFKAGATHAKNGLFEAQMSNIPHHTGHSPLTWEGGTN